MTRDITTPTIYQATAVGTAPKFNEAFAKGCGGQLINLKLDAEEFAFGPGPVALWGEHKLYKQLHRAIAAGQTWYYGDHAYFGRGKFFRITKNALQVSGAFFDGGPDAERHLARLKEVAAITPIRIGEQKPRGDFIMVCPPSEALAERSGFLKDDWTRRITNRLKGLTKKPLVIRDKPKVNHTPLPLLQALVGCDMVVTYTSNAAVEAVVDGYPAICTGPNPANVFTNSFEKLDKPFVAPVDSRMAWAGMMCANQWTLEEIAAGKAWEALTA